MYKVIAYWIVRNTWLVSESQSLLNDAFKRAADLNIQCKENKLDTQFYVPVYAPNGKPSSFNDFTGFER